MSTTHRTLDERHHLVLRLMATVIVILITGAAVGLGLAVVIGRVIGFMTGLVDE